MEAPHEKTYRSPQRKLVKFFERSRDQWKAKSRAAKTALKRLGRTRLRRVEERNATYQEQLAARQTQVAEWRAQHEQTARELTAVKKKRRTLGWTVEGWGAGAGTGAVPSL